MNGAPVARSRPVTPRRSRKASPSASITWVDRVSRGKVACSSTATRRPARASRVASGDPAHLAPTTITSNDSAMTTPGHGFYRVGGRRRAGRRSVTGCILLPDAHSREQTFSWSRESRSCCCWPAWLRSRRIVSDLRSVVDAVRGVAVMEEPRREICAAARALARSQSAHLMEPNADGTHLVMTASAGSTCRRSRSRSARSRRAAWSPSSHVSASSCATCRSRRSPRAGSRSRPARDRSSTSPSCAATSASASWPSPGGGGSGASPRGARRSSPCWPRRPPTRSSAPT